jgi:sigma-54 dependent transcriptional regulator, acetoin dehydrogenase operon transcriptional activator AcoR
MQESTAVQHAADVLRFVRGGIDRPSERNAVISTAIANSWRRCVTDYSLDPGQRHPAPVVDSHVLRGLRDQHEELVQIASAEIDWLYEHIAGSGYALLLTDASGIILYEKAEPTLAKIFHSAGLLTGADWSEPSQGTNGMGTCIAERRAVTVHLDEHFHGCHIGLSCSAAPICDPSGSLLAVLDASTLDARDTRVSQAHTMALVSLSARLIEKCVFLRHFREGLVLRFHARPELVNLQHDGALALGPDATILSADGTAIRLLGARHRNELIGRRIDEVFDVRPDDILGAHQAARTGLLTVRDAFLGRRFFASVAQDLTSMPSTLSTRFSVPHSVLQLPASSARKSALQLEELAGDDPQMLRNVRSARRVASTQVSVMIQGPTGAGKEAFARALHSASGRADKPFVALNCAAIPESLIESELFGYRPGAFTGARREGMKGKILQSSGGTLFLDEIGDMPLLLQTRLLRVLEEQEVMPLGAETPLKVDLHVICASHQNLRAMIARGTFREDLYYRLNGITLELPSLAQRTDKERLIREFLAAETSDGRPAAIEMDAFQCLLSYAWPGNIRELRNVIRTALAICDGGVVRLSDLPSEVREHTPQAALAVPAAAHSIEGSGDLDSMPLCEAPFDAAEREVLLRIIRENAGNMSHAAKALGVSRNTLYRRCKRLGLSVQRPRSILL